MRRQRGPLAPALSPGYGGEGVRTRAALPLQQQQRDQLDRFAEPHVVRQTRADPQPIEERHPIQPAQLIGPHGSIESGGCGYASIFAPGDCSSNCSIHDVPPSPSTGKPVSARLPPYAVRSASASVNDWLFCFSRNSLAVSHGVEINLDPLSRNFTSGSLRAASA